MILPNETLNQEKSDIPHPLRGPEPSERNGAGFYCRSEIAKNTNNSGELFSDVNDWRAFFRANRKNGAAAQARLSEKARPARAVPEARNTNDGGRPSGTCRSPCWSNRETVAASKKLSGPDPRKTTYTTERSDWVITMEPGYELPRMDRNSAGLPRRRDAASDARRLSSASGQLRRLLGVPRGLPSDYPARACRLPGRQTVSTTRRTPMNRREILTMAGAAAAAGVLISSRNVVASPSARRSLRTNRWPSVQSPAARAPRPAER